MLEFLEGDHSGTAVSFHGEVIDYPALHARADRLAAHLIAAGVGPDVLVGVCLERSIDLVVALLAVLKAGGAYVPLDPEYPADRLAYMITDSGLRIMLTQRSLRSRLPPSEASIVCLDDGEPLSGASGKPVSRAAPEHLAYVIYTSGSTGRPKGVQISRAALDNFLESMRLEPGLQRSDVLLAVTSISFDIAGLELFLPLSVGARLALVTRDAAMSAPALIEALTQENATVMQATPTTWRMLLLAGWKGHKTLKALCGGEAMQSSLAGPLLERVASLWNMYGPTETTIWSTVHQVTAADLKSATIPIGHPIRQTQVYVLDAKLARRPVGESGDLYIGGAGLARGYHGDPAQTKTKFIPSPFDGQLIYLTGDQARVRADGNIDFLGRIDQQVKIRGARVDVGEVEVALLGHEAIGEAVVVACQDRAGATRLVAYCVVAPRAARPAAAIIRTYLKGQLPAYMVPSTVVFLERLPLTANNKVDRKALPDPKLLEEADEASDAIIAPRNPLEEALVGLFQELLDVRRVSVTDDFFELGGHSILVAELVARLAPIHDPPIAPSTIFRGRTAEKIARLAQTSSHARSLPLELIQLSGGEGTLPPLFIVHPTAGHATCYFELAQMLVPDQPVYGFQHPGLFGGEFVEGETIEDRAAHYVRAMRLICPDGPYFVSGWSGGGMIAFEIAQQLRRLGLVVAFVGLIDCLASGHHYSTLDDAQAAFMFLRNRMRFLSESLPITLAELKPLGSDALFDRVKDYAVGRGLLPKGISREDVKRHVLVTKELVQMSLTYSCSYFQGDVTVFQTPESHSEDGFEKPRGLKWEPFVQRLDVATVAGDHFNVVAVPHVTALANAMRPRLEAILGVKVST